jgi:membrane protease YdiL (CAAX protease family)
MEKQILPSPSLQSISAKFPLSTIAGLLLAFFGLPLVVYLNKILLAGHPPSNLTLITRELCIFLLLIPLFVIIIKGENLGLDSIGLYNRNWGKSILWGVGTMLVCFIVGLTAQGMLSAAGVAGRDPLGEMKNISPWTMKLIILRAGVMEEVFYRGYIMERLAKRYHNWFIYFLFPSVMFGLFHYGLGTRGMVVAFCVSVVLSFSYWKSRDLKANIIGHFLVDFISLTFGHA